VIDTGSAHRTSSCSLSAVYCAFVIYDLLCFSVLLLSSTPSMPIFGNCYNQKACLLTNARMIVWNKTTWNSLTHTRAEKTTDLSQVTDKLYHKLRTARPDQDHQGEMCFCRSNALIPCSFCDSKINIYIYRLSSLWIYYYFEYVDCNIWFIVLFRLAIKLHSFNAHIWKCCSLSAVYCASGHWHY
jgi:hypothetical protein